MKKRMNNLMQPASKGDAKLPRWIDNLKGKDQTIDALIEYIEAESPSKPQLSDADIIKFAAKSGLFCTMPQAVSFGRAILQSLPRDKDGDRINWLEAAAENGHVSMCFETDGGVHLTLDGVGETQEAYRNKNTIREAIDAAIAASSTTKGQ